MADVFLSDDLLPALGGDPRKLRLLEWLLTAPAEREPKTASELADTLEVSRRSIYAWKNDDAFQAVWRAQAAKVAGGIERTQALLDRAYDIALSDATDRMKAMDLFIKTTQAIAPKDTPRAENPLATKTLEELEAMYATAISTELAARKAKESV